MKTDIRLGTFPEVIASASAEVKQIAEYLRTLIGELHADCIELPRPGERSASYGVGPKKMSEAYAYIMPHKAHVNLGFYHGVNVPDPQNLLEGTGKKLRHIKLHSLPDAQQPAVRELLIASINERQTALGKA